MRSDRRTARTLPLLLAGVLLASACGGGDNEAATDSATSASRMGTSEPTAQATEHGTGASTESATSEPSSTATDDSSGSGGSGGSATSDATTGPPAGSQGESIEDPALQRSADATIAALTGTDWGAVYDITCAEVHDGASREEYVEGFAGSGTPRDLAGSELSVGRVVSGEEADASELPPVSGEVRWVTLLRDGSPEDVFGVARFVEQGDGWAYCGLGL
jgi:hypothetical protein